MYEKFRTILTYDEYFSTWEKDTLKELTPELMQSIYDKYVIKCKVFQRDKFRCTNNSCVVENELTLHHVKYQRNGGKDSERNCVTLCKSCHKNFHRGKITITYNGLVPPHIAGHTFKEERPYRINWKQIKSEMAILRKNLKEYHGITISGEEAMILLKWLFIPYDEMEEFDD